MTELSTSKRFTDPVERARRLARLREAMARDGIDVLVVHGSGGSTGRVFYVSDYLKGGGNTEVVLTRSAGPILVGNPFLGLSMARLTDWVTEFRMSGTPGVEVGHVIAELGEGESRVGVVGLSDGSFAYSHYQDLSRTVPRAEIVDATDLFESVRQVLTETDIERSAEVSQVFTAIFDEIEPFIIPGVTENEIQVQAFRSCLAHGVAQPYILVLSTPYSGDTGFGSPKVIDRSSIVTVWIEGVSAAGYNLEYRRCYSFGPPPQEYIDFWELTKNATEAGLAELRPGRPASGFVEAMKRVMQDGGFDIDYDGPVDQHHMYTLHGTGFDGCQGVWLPGKDRILAENEVVNIHARVTLESQELLRKFDMFGITDNAMVGADGGRWMTHDKAVSRGFVQLG